MDLDLTLLGVGTTFAAERVDMSHLPYEKLNDLNEILARVRKLSGVNELEPGIFYLRNQAFMHFHVEGEERFAHVRGADGWRRVYIPLHARGVIRRDACDQIVESYVSQVTTQ